MLKIQNYNIQTYKLSLQKQPAIKLEKDIYCFKGGADSDKDLNPTPQEIKDIIKHLPKSEKEAEQTAKSDVKNLISQINDLIETENIRTPEEYKEYMEIYVILGKKVFDKLSPDQKEKSILLQEKSIEEMNKEKLKIKSNSKESALQTLLDAQIQMSTDLLQYCNRR